MARDWSYEEHVAPAASMTVRSCDVPFPGNVMEYGHPYGCRCYSCAARTFTGTTIWLTQPPADPPSLSDDDVKRIAREVVRLMRADGHDPGDEDA